MTIGLAANGTVYSLDSMRVLWTELQRKVIYLASYNKIWYWAHLRVYKISSHVPLHASVVSSPSYAFQKSPQECGMLAILAKRRNTQLVWVFDRLAY
jgi:hypothetical protein